MKKFVFVLAMLLGGLCLNAAFLQPVADIDLQVQAVNPTNPHGERPRTPIVIPHVSIEVHTLYFNNVGYDLTLVLVDEENEVAYTTLIPAHTSSIILPHYLDGDYKIELFPGGYYYFYGWIVL